MSSAAARGAVSAGPGGWVPAAGLRILVPGWPQWAWCQRARALVLLGSYLSALGVGLFAWGTVASPLMLAFAFATHAASATDVIRQRAFPGFGRWVPAISASAGLGLGYAPVFWAIWMVAWPGERIGRPGEGYLVNLWAYRGASPGPGHRIWYDRGELPGRGVGKVLAGQGQEVEWAGGGIRVDGRPVGGPPAGRDHAIIAGQRVVMRVPEGYTLIAPSGADPDGAPGEPAPLLVESGRIRGRVWAQYAPIWARRLLR